MPVGPRARDVTGRLGRAGGCARRCFPRALFRTEAGFPWSPRHPLGAQSAAVPGRRQLPHSGPPRSGAASAAAAGWCAPASVLSRARLSPDGWCRATAPGPAPAATAAGQCGVSGGARCRFAWGCRGAPSPKEVPCRPRPSKLTAVSEVGGSRGKDRVVFIIYMSGSQGDDRSV